MASNKANQQNFANYINYIDVELAKIPRQKRPHFNGPYVLTFTRLLISHLVHQ